MPCGSFSGRAVFSPVGQGWMAVKNLRRWQAELLAEALDQPMADEVGIDGQSAFAFERGHLAETVAIDAAEMLKSRINVEGGAEVADPVAHRDADVRQQPARRLHTGAFAIESSVSTKIGCSFAERGLQIVQIGSQVQAEAVQRKNGVYRELAAEMQQSAPAAIHPANWPAAKAQLAVIEVNLLATAVPADGNQRWVFAKDQRSLAAIT